MIYIGSGDVGIVHEIHPAHREAQSSSDSTEERPCDRCREKLVPEDTPNSSEVGEEGRSRGEAISARGNGRSNQGPWQSRYHSDREEELEWFGFSRTMSCV